MSKLSVYDEDVIVENRGTAIKTAVALAVQYAGKTKPTLIAGTGAKAAGLLRHRSSKKGKKGNLLLK